MNGDIPRPGGQHREDAPEGAFHGQVIIMFALFASAMFGILGLAIDLGFAFAERRTVQNAGDLAAVAGARAIVRYVSSGADTPNRTSAETDVIAVRDGNQMGGVVPTINSCKYVDYALSELADCSATAPVGATGVSVSISETHPTTFIRIFPWAPATLTTSASSTAYIERTKYAGTDSRFIICGHNSKTVDSLDSTAAPTGTQSILMSDGGGLVVDPAAIGKTFRIVDNTASNIARYGTSGGTWSLWTGLANSSANVPAGKEVGDYWYIESTATLNAIVNVIPGIEGCADEAGTPYDCVVIIPVACDSNLGCVNFQGTTVTGGATGRRLWVAKSLAFRIHACGTNCLNGTLLDDYLMSDMTYPGPSNTSPWTRDSGGGVGIKLND
jgi:Flp pilus assembly protein TadG